MHHKRLGIVFAGAALSVAPVLMMSGQASAQVGVPQNGPQVGSGLLGEEEAALQQEEVVLQQEEVTFIGFEGAFIGAFIAYDDGDGGYVSHPNEQLAPPI